MASEPRGRRLARTHRAHLTDLRRLRPGWAAGVGDPPAPKAIAVAAALLREWPLAEQAAWTIVASPDATLHLERATHPAAHGALMFVDVDARGGCRFVLFDHDERHTFTYPSAAVAANDIASLIIGLTGLAVSA